MFLLTQAHKNLKEIFILAHGFRGLSSQSVEPLLWIRNKTKHHGRDSVVKHLTSDSQKEEVAERASACSPLPACIACDLLPINLYPHFLHYIPMMLLYHRNPTYMYWFIYFLPDGSRMLCKKYGYQLGNKLSIFESFFSKRVLYLDE